MPRYVIERELPGAGNLSEKDLITLSQRSCRILDNLGTQIQWVESFVTENKIYCIYQASSRALVMQHASMGDFPANRIEEITTVINPITAERPAVKA